MKIHVIAAGAAMLVAGCATTADDAGPAAAGAPADVTAADAPAASANALPTTAPAYMQMAASGDLFEIESSRLALQRSQNPAVRSIAQMLIDDHTRTSREMMSAATAARLTPAPPQLLPHHAEMLQRLQAATGDFDMAYRSEQIPAHQEALMLHQTYAAQGDVQALRAVASRAVPIIQAHLSQLQALQISSAGPPADSGGSDTAARRAGERG